MEQGDNRRPVSPAPVHLTPPQISRVRAVLMLGGVRYADLDDGVQTVQLKVLEAHENGSEAIKNLDGWIAVVASRVAVDSHRSNGRQANLLGRLRQNVRREPQNSFERHRVYALTLAQELEGMSFADRQVLVLRYYADLTVAQIADALEVPEGTVKSRIHMASKRLRNLLEEAEKHDN